MSRTKITTISGAIGVGKSTVLDILRKRDFNVVPSVGKTEGTVQKILQMKYLDEFTTWRWDIINFQNMMVSDRLVNLAHVTRNKERKDTLLDRGFIDALAFALIELGNEDYEKLLAMYKPSIQFELEQLGFNHIFILISSYSKDLIITRLNKRDKVLTTKQKERSLNNIERFDDAYRTVMFHLGLVNDYIEINANNSPETIADEIEKILAQKDCSSD